MKSKTNIYGHNRLSRFRSQIWAWSDHLAPLLWGSARESTADKDTLVADYSRQFRFSDKLWFSYHCGNWPSARYQDTFPTFTSGAPPVPIILPRGGLGSNWLGADSGPCSQDYLSEFGTWYWYTSKSSLTGLIPKIGLRIHMIMQYDDVHTPKVLWM